MNGPPGVACPLCGSWQSLQLIFPSPTGWWFGRSKRPFISKWQEKQTSGFLSGLIIVFRAPPDCVCRLPGPWQLSQPIFCAFDPCAINLACVAVVKCLFTSVWHSAHALEPTNSAPGTSGGIITTRFTVTHEISTPADISANTIHPTLRRSRLGVAGFGVFIK